jgi:hypothetical protein
MKLTLALTAIVVASPRPASAEAAGAPRWDPGHRTTSRLADEARASSTPSTGDGVYGRFDGLFDLGLHAGAEIGDGAAGAVRASIHYFSMAGVYVGYADTLGNPEPRSRRSLSFGVDLRPAFVPRWSKDMEAGPSVLDLSIDSISLGLGVYLREPVGAPFGDRRGLELSLGAGLPLAGRADGPWLGARGNLRWDDPASAAGEPARATLLATLGWHWMID